MSESKTSKLWYLVPTVVVMALGVGLGVLLSDGSTLLGRVTFGCLVGGVAVSVGGAVWMRRDTIRMRQEREALDE